MDGIQIEFQILTLEVILQKVRSESMNWFLILA